MIRFLKIAIEESQEAALWYDKREIGLGSEFMAELDQAYDLIEARPREFFLYELYRGSHEVRRYILKKFAYIAFYTMWLGKPVIVAIAHKNREPLYWIDRLNRLS